MNKINLAVIGLGLRGFSVLKSVLLKIQDVNVISVCDIYEDRLENAQKEIAKYGYTAQAFTDYKEALNVKGLDGAVVVTPWRLHTEISIYAMKKGIPVASEVGSEYSLDNCFELVKTQEQTNTPFMFMENCCYGKDELLATNMARKGLFGHIVHCSGAYAHDLRSEVSYGVENRHYRFDNYLHRNCENYPTHELGPIARLLNINRGNKIVSVSSIASKSIGLKEFIKEKSKTEKLPDYLLNANFKQGDIIDTLIKCQNGETIHIKLDTTLPRFYTRAFTIRGTKGFYEQNTNTVFIEGTHHEKYWEPVESYKELINNAKEYEDKYLPDIWKNLSEEDKKSGHGGIDYFVYRDFVKCIKNKKEMPINVYDAATWLAVSVLSENSIINNGEPQIMPDFTNGKWLTNKPKDVIEF